MAGRRFCSGIWNDTGFATGRLAQEGDYQYSVEEDETVTLRNYIGTESVIVTPKEVGGKK